MNEEIITLIDKYLLGEASEMDRERVDSWYQLFESNPGLMAKLSPQEAVKAAADNFVIISHKLDFC